MSGFFRRLFRRDAPPPPMIDRRDNSEDWRIGDLAVCISGEGWTTVDAHNPNTDDLLRVRTIIEGTGQTRRNELFIGLGFEGKPPALHWESRAFRKIRPEHKAADEECAPLMRVLRGPKVKA